MPGKSRPSILLTTIMSDAIPESTLPYPPVHDNKPFVVLSDWDGTITLQDSNDYMTDNLGFGKDRRRQGNLDVLAGKQTFRDGFREMLQSIVANGWDFDACKDVLRKNIKLDPGFKEFYAWCEAADIPFVIVSSGMAPSIRAVLSNLLGDEVAERIDIIANDVEIQPDGKWTIKYRHPSSCLARTAASAMTSRARSCHTKTSPTRPCCSSLETGYQASLAPHTIVHRTVLTCADMSAARHADVLFVKEKLDGENDLAAYCVREGIPHILFSDFAQALHVVQAVVSGEKTAQEVLTIGKA
ncbi:unnamed protein product [Mycena citricolor]|uniref:Uncharacterized protein n=1 Tax=Mycena citricolor TaxID=2018698 RepID=A0AAD2H495_9AGAR|nr:unnamed protein product [Mycena citricolor]